MDVREEEGSKGMTVKDIQEPSGKDGQNLDFLRPRHLQPEHIPER